MARREIIEDELMERTSYITPITPRDQDLFRRYGTEFKASIHYHARECGGWNQGGESESRLGMKYFDGGNLATFAFFKQDPGCFVVIPLKSDDDHLEELVSELNTVSGSKVYLTTVGIEQADRLVRRSAAFTFVKGDDSVARGFCRETFPARVVGIERMLYEAMGSGSFLYTGSIKFKKKYRGYSFQGYNPASDEEKVKSLFRDVLEESQSRYHPEDFWNMLKSNDPLLDRDIFLIDGKFVGFLAGERDDDIFNIYAIIARKEYAHLKEFMLFEKLIQVYRTHSIWQANLGGSETQEEDTFKRKIPLIWSKNYDTLLFDPPRTMAPISTLEFSTRMR